MRKPKKEEIFGRIVRTFANSSKTREAFSSSSHIASKVKSSKKVEKNFSQIRYLIDLMNDFCCCKAYLRWKGSEADVELL
jgi:hypothetical protein